MNKILTVVIPTYNMEKYLRRCLDSLIIDDKELFDSLEVLVINDGSKDSSSAIAHEYQDKYPNVFHVVDKENGNYGSCANRGIKEASGKYFRLLDADDYFVEGAICVFIKKLALLDKDVDIVYTPYQIELTKKKIFERHRYVGVRYDDIIDLFKEGLTGFSYINFTMHALTYRTEFLHRIGFKQQEGISYTDTEYVYYPFVVAKNFIAFDILLYNYVIGVEGQTVSIASMVKNKNNYWKLFERYIKDVSYVNGNLCAQTIRRIILERLLNPMLEIYTIYSDYDKQEDFKLRNALRQVRECDSGIFYSLMKVRRKKVLYLYALWYVLGKCYFWVRGHKKSM